MNFLLVYDDNDSGVFINSITNEVLLPTSKISLPYESFQIVNLPIDTESPIIKTSISSKVYICRNDNAIRNIFKNIPNLVKSIGEIDNDTMIIISNISYFDQDYFIFNNALRENLESSLTDNIYSQLSDAMFNIDLLNKESDSFTHENIALKSNIELLQNQIHDKYIKNIDQLSMENKELHLKINELQTSLQNSQNQNIRNTADYNESIKTLSDKLNSRHSEEFQTQQCQYDQSQSDRLNDFNNVIKNDIYNTILTERTNAMNDKVNESFDLSQGICRRQEEYNIHLEKSIINFKKALDDTSNELLSVLHEKEDYTEYINREHDKEMEEQRRVAKFLEKRLRELTEISDKLTSLVHAARRGDIPIQYDCTDARVLFPVDRIIGSEFKMNESQLISLFKNGQIKDLNNALSSIDDCHSFISRLSKEWNDIKDNLYREAQSACEEILVNNETIDRIAKLENRLRALR